MSEPKNKFLPGVLMLVVAVLIMSAATFVARPTTAPSYVLSGWVSCVFAWEHCRCGVRANANNPVAKPPHAAGPLVRNVSVISPIRNCRLDTCFF